MTEYTVEQVVAAVEAVAGSKWQDTDAVTRHLEGLSLTGYREASMEGRREAQRTLKKAHRQGLVAHDVRHGGSGGYGNYGRRRAHWTTLAHKAKLDKIAARTPADWAEIAHAEVLHRFNARVAEAGDAYYKMTVDSGWVRGTVHHAIEAGLVVQVDRGVIPVEGVERYEAAKARHEANVAAVNSRVDRAAAAFDAAAGPHDHRHPSISVGIDQVERLLALLEARSCPSEVVDES